MMNWYKNAQLAEQDVRQHLLDRGFDADHYQYDYDVETGTIRIRLYSTDGKFIGYHEYRPHTTNKGGDDKRSHTKRYHTDVPDKNKAQTAFWGVENIDPNKSYLFITEGIFDAAPINQLGEPAISVLGANISGSKMQQLRFLGKKLIAILDNDKAGTSVQLRSKGDAITHGDLKPVIEMLGGEVHIAPDPYKDFGEMYQKDPQIARDFITSIINAGG